MPPCRLPPCSWPAGCGRAGGRAVRLDQGGGVLGLGEHRLEPAAAGLLIGELGGDDQPVVAGHVLGVVALDEPAAADRHQPRVRVGDVPHRAGPLPVRLPPGGLACLLSGPGPGRVHLGLGFLDPAEVTGPRSLRCGRAAPAGLPGRISRLQPGQLRGPRGPGPGQVQLGHLHRRRLRRPPGILPSRPPRLVGLRPGLLRLLRGLTLGFQVPQRRGDPLIAPPRAPRLLRHLIPPPALPEQLILGRISRRMRGHPLPGQPGQRVPGPVRRLRRRRGDLHPVQRHHPYLAHAQPGAEHQHPGKEIPGRLREISPEPGHSRMIRQVPRADHPERHVRPAQPLDIPRGNHPVRIRPHQHGHQHVRVITRRTRAARPPASMERRRIQVIFYHPDHQPHRMISRQPLPHIRREQERLITVHRPVPLRHTPTLSNPASTRTPTRRESATARLAGRTPRSLSRRVVRVGRNGRARLQCMVVAGAEWPSSH